MLGGFQVLLCGPPAPAARRIRAAGSTGTSTATSGQGLVCRTVPAEAWRRRHAAALVKLLALAPDRRLHREQVLATLWPDTPVDDAAPRLHKATYYARRALGSLDTILLRGDVFTLCPDRDVSVDAHRFRDLARRALCEEGGAARWPAVDAAGAARAADAYGGPLLPDDLYEQWTQDERDRLRILYARLLRLTGRWEELLTEDPADEEAHLALIRRHAGQGERHAALRQFERMDRSLRREHGVGPSAEALACVARLTAWAGSPGRPRGGRETVAGVAIGDLEELAAREAIRQQLHNYCRAMDRRDDELGYAVWHEDGTADFGPEIFQGRGRDFVDQVSRNHLRRLAHSHQIATVGIEVDGDRAASEAYVTVRLVSAVAGGFTEELYAGRYLDRWSCRDGRWAIDHRVWVLDLGELDRPVATHLPAGGRRDPRDPSYELFRALRE